MHRLTTWASARCGASVYRAAARRYKRPVVYVNQVGGNDQLVFDGSSFAMSGGRRGDRVGTVFRRRPGDRGYATRGRAICTKISSTNAKLFIRPWCWARAITSASADFREVLIGLSGGIDSSLTAAIAVEAVGRENVTGVAMPGPYSSEHSVAGCERDGGKDGYPVRDHLDRRGLSSRFKGHWGQFSRVASWT